jgi:Mg2+-importing ATPase
LKDNNKEAPDSFWNLSSLLGFWQERDVANTVNELLKLVKLHCAVLRDGKKQELPVETVVPGDAIFLSAADIIPDDCV